MGMENPSEPQGTALTPDEWRGKEIFFRNFHTKFTYSWDTGVAIGHFLEALKAGKIVGRSCSGCNRVLVPPRMFCELCFRPTDDWIDVLDTGVVNTFSISYVNNDASRREQPLFVAVINIDGASPGMGFLHLLGEVDAGQIHVGMKVRAKWKPAHERTGAITDISYFKPSEGL